MNDHRRVRSGAAGFTFALTLVAAAAARADPCEAPLPRPGQAFAGPVRYVGDGDSLCVEVTVGIGGAGWVEVRLADFNAPELSEPGGGAARDRLSRLTFGRALSCVAGRRSYDRVVALCQLDNSPLGDQLRADGGREGGR